MTSFKRFCLVLLVALAGAAAMSALPALATQGDTLVYRGGAQGKVVFDGRIHAGKGFTCSSCHAGLFTTQREGRITMADHTGNGKCFACHNGSTAFNTCTQCHRGVPNT